jgi:hypothetical protein
MFKGMNNAIQRDMMSDRAKQSCTQRQLANVATSFHAPFGKRIESILLNGDKLITASMVNKANRIPVSQPILVPHLGETAQLNALREHMEEKPRKLVEILKRLGLAKNWRNAEIPLNAGNLKKSLRDHFLNRNQ